MRMIQVKVSKRKKIILKHINKYFFVETSSIDVYVTGNCYLELKEYRTYDDRLGKIYYSLNRYEIGYGNSWLYNAINKLDDSRISMVNADYQFGPVNYCYIVDDDYKDLACLVQEVIRRQIEEKKDVIEIDMQEVVDIMNMCEESDDYQINDFKLFKKISPLVS